jgi:hypothetical protein
MDWAALTSPGSLKEPPLFAALAPAGRVLIAGAGGGFDIYAGLPLAHALAKEGKRVHLGNLTFSDLSGLALDDWVAPGVAAIRPESAGPREYFPERTLARWLAGRMLDPVVYAFERVGVQPLRRAYRELVERLEVDAIVLVDGGTDILMRGDEAGLGTPEEDMASLVAVAGLDVPVRLVVCAGFGIDSFHGVCHAHVLENIAALDRDGAYLGALSIPARSQEGEAYLDAVAHAQEHTPQHPSIVNGQIAAAMCGVFGDKHFTTRTGGSELFINPLMAIYFSFQLTGVYKRLLYKGFVELTHTWTQMGTAIERFRLMTDPRKHVAIPH